MKTILVRVSSRAHKLTVRVLAREPDSDRPELWDGDDERFMSEAEIEEIIGRGDGDPDVHGYPGLEGE